MGRLIIDSKQIFHSQTLMSYLTEAIKVVSAGLVFLDMIEKFTLQANKK